MIFAVINSCPEERRHLTDLLLSLYPGSIIYEFAQASELLPYMRTHSLEAVFMELTTEKSADIEALDKIRNLKPGLPVMIFAEDDSMLEEAMWNGATNYCIKPVFPELIQGFLA